jgi:hypothetical protein
LILASPSTGAVASTATPTPPAPSLPVLDLPRSARTEENGVRVTITLERNPMPAGVATWVTTKVKNTGRDDMTWFHDGCAISVGVGGELDAARWREGRPQLAPAQAWKGYLLDTREPDAGALNVAFTPERFIGRGSIGCADIGIGDRVAPGETIEQRLQWNGLAADRLVPPPTDHVDLVGTFGYYWRASDGNDVDDIPSRTIEVHLETWIEGDGIAWLHPADAVDAALLDTRLTKILASRRLHNGNERLLRFDPKTGLYEIGLVESGDLPVPRAEYTQIDARTGAIVGFIDRAWDFSAEGNP